MSRNGSGTYTLPAGNPVVTGTTISSTWANSTLTNIASALTDSLAADGQTTATGNLKMGNNRITGLADGIASTDAASVTQVTSAVAITGGTINGTTIGATTRSTVKATTLDLGLSTQSVAIGQGDSSSLKNRIINGNFYIAQRATSATITAGSTIAAGYATVDRFYGYCTGANVTMAQVAGAGNNRNLLQFTGAASVTAIGCGQRIESLNSYDLAGQTVTLSAFIANSLLTSVTWTAYYANTTDTFGTLASPTRTQIATGTFTVTSTLTQYNAQIAIPLAATTGIEIVFTVGAQTSGTWQLDKVQLELGSSATGFEYRQYGTELALCQRYFEKSYNTDVAIGTVTNIGMASWQATNASTVVNQRCLAYFRVTKRTTATGATFSPNSGNSAKLYNTRAAADDDTVIQTIGSNSLQIQDQNAGVLTNDTLNFHWTASAEL